MHRLRAQRADLLALLLIVALALLWFAPVLLPALTGAGLLPYDNLYAFEPWRSLRPELLPHNELLSDLVLQNAGWKLHIRETLAAGDIPLWNPKSFTGIPFLAGGQASTFYPLNLLFYVLPLDLAYGWFTALQVALAGVSCYLFGRALRLRPAAALFGGVVYMFSGFLIASVVFTMFVAAVPWLPLLLAIIETILRKQEEKGVRAFQPIPYVLAGALVLGMVVLAGHPELIYYTAIVAALYTAMRLFVAGRGLAALEGVTRGQAVRRLARLTGWLLALAALGVTLGSIQLIPLLELLPLNFRDGSATLEQVRGWAWPSRQLLTFFLPNVFGSPSHHQWFDLWQGTWAPAAVNALGQRSYTIFWGVKNYVEGANYLGLATWLLSALAVVFAWRGRRRALALFFGGLALLSLLFAFGTPLYALLYYGVPGWNQLHSPFRWVFPFTLSMAMLAAIGLDGILAMGEETGRQTGRRVAHWLGIGAISAGGVALALLLASRFGPAPFINFGQRIVDGSDLAQMAFAGGRMFWGYQAGNLLHAGLVLALSGAALLLLLRGGPKAQIMAVALSLVVAGDLYAAHGRFNPATDPALSPLTAAGKPAVVEFIEAREAGNDQPWRFTTFALPGEKTFNANVGLYYGWHDIRGYDSIIPRQYVELMNRIQPQANELLYNRIAPLYAQPGGDVYAVLANPLLDLLNVKYILSTHAIPDPTWQEIYADGSLRVYENRELQPRAFFAKEAQVLPAADQPLLESDLRTTVFLEETPADSAALMPASPQIAEARVSRYTANELFVDVNLSDRGWLVVTDAWFPGWKAYLRPFGGDENNEVELPIYRANGVFRAVYLAADGPWTVRFVYSPMSFKIGLYLSFLAAMALLLLALYWLWGRYYRPENESNEVRRVAKNSLVPMGLSLVNKAIDFAFAMLYVRILGPEGTGQYYFVVAIYGFFEIVSRYGLGTLLTRDVAADKNQSSRYLTAVLSLRTLLWAASVPLMALVVFGYRWLYEAGWSAENMGQAEILALALLAGGMLLANYADAYSSLFFAFEKMEYPAGLANAGALIKVTLSMAALLLGYGFVGMAAVALLTNLIQLIWLNRLVRSTLFKPQWVWDWPLQRTMLRDSGPLMINHLLATIFWRIDVWILRPLAGAFAVGLYSVGYKYLDGLNIIPSVFTMAIFPLMSRMARETAGDASGEAGGGKPALLRAYVISLRLLVMVSLPIAMAVTFLAEPLVYVVGGAQYLNTVETAHLFGRQFTFTGGADLAFQFIIWSIPIGFVNSITQYVLIAVHQQHYLTRAFLMGVIFNIVGNLILIPRLGYIGAAIATIFSEFSLLFPFYYSVRRHVGVVPWGQVFLPPALAMGVMGASIWGLLQMELNLWLAVAAGTAIYLPALILSGAFAGPEMAAIIRALPLSAGVKGLLAGRVIGGSAGGS